MAKCLVCKEEQFGYNWTVTKNGKKWLQNSDGKWHDCPANEKKPRFKAMDMYNVDLFKPLVTEKGFYFCGKCTTLCIEEKNFDLWCPKCEMFPRMTNRGSNTEDNKNFVPNEKVNAVMITNELDVWDEARRRNQNAPVNWSNMNIDGTIKSGYKLDDLLKSWFVEKGEQILKDIHAKIWFKPKTR